MSINNLAQKKGTFFAVLIITLLISFVAFFGVDIGPVHLKGASDMRFGIDIRGGINAVFVPKDLDREPSAEELEAAKAVIETRLDQRGILDRDVTSDSDVGSIIVNFPWKADETDFDPEKAIAELGSMAMLSFKDPDGEVVMEGKHVAKATAGQDTDPQSLGGFVVNLTLKPEGRKAFADATERLVGQTITIYLDDNEISSPTVESRIDSEECVINRIGSMEEARTLANQINAGALPFALITDNYNTISPNLGSNALGVMVWAGIVAFALICLFLIFYYRLSGVVASISLLLQVAGQLILLTWPQFSITLPGIAGIILSIGMGVDANIISAERIREELKAGKTSRSAALAGFKASFSSIFDGNITVLIVALVMMYFGSGAILSFSYTLLFGIVMNFVAGVTATKLMTISLVQNSWLGKPSFFLRKKKMEDVEVKVIPFFKRRKVFYAVSALIMIVGVVLTYVNGVTLDIQFKGGTILKYSLSEDVELDSNEAAEKVAEVLDGRPVTGQITTSFATGDKVLVLSMPSSDQNFSNEDLGAVTETLTEAYPDQTMELVDSNNVTPFYGDKFRKDATVSIILAAILVILYVWYSFRKIHGLSAGFMSLVALLHDVLIVFFTFTIFKIPIGDSFVAVALAILGYSINDTIVIYDRIRENSRREISRKDKMPVEGIVDKSISQSVARSINTNLAVFASIAVLYVFAAINNLDTIVSFALPMAIGSISGCYSTICIVGPLWAAWEKRKQRKLAAAKG